MTQFPFQQPKVQQNKLSSKVRKLSDQVKDKVNAFHRSFRDKWIGKQMKQARQKLLNPIQVVHIVRSSQKQQKRPLIQIADIQSDKQDGPQQTHFQPIDTQQQHRVELRPQVQQKYVSTEMGGSRIVLRQLSDTKTVYDIRLCITPFGGSQYFTRRGVQLTPDEFTALKRSVRDINQLLDSYIPQSSQKQVLWQQQLGSRQFDTYRMILDVQLYKGIVYVGIRSYKLIKLIKYIPTRIGINLTIDEWYSLTDQFQQFYF